MCRDLLPVRTRALRGLIERMDAAGRMAHLQRGDRHMVVGHLVGELMVVRRRHTVVRHRHTMAVERRLMVERLPIVAGLQVMVEDLTADLLLHTAEVVQRQLTVEAVTPLDLAAEAVGMRHPVAEEAATAAVGAEATAGADVTKAKQTVYQKPSYRTAFLLATGKHLNRSI